MANITGTSGPDLLQGTSNNDVISGLGGDDVLFGGPGDDTLIGGDGNDFLSGDEGNDSLDGGAGNDALLGGLGNDTLLGGAGADNLRDGDGFNVLDGGDGDDIFFVSVEVGSGSTVTGGAGSDFYFLDPNSPSLGAGSTGQNYVITDFQVGAGGDLLFVLGLFIVPTQTGPFSQTFIYGGGDPFALGFLRFLQSGADTLVQGDRDGAAGSAFGFTTAATLKNVTASTITFDNLPGLIIGTLGNDRLVGDPTDENLMIGGGGDDTLVGGNNDDVLEGGQGADRMEGGPGNDTYFVDDPGDVVVETSNIPLASGLQLADASIANALGGITDTVIAAINYSLSLPDLQYVENITLNSNSTATVATGNALENVLTGNALNNRLTGLAGNDTIDGGAGVDTAVFNSNRAANTIAKTSSYTVSGPEGSDTLSNVERFQFSDKKVAVDLDLGAAAGNTVRIIGAAFDAPNIQQHPDWVGIGLNFFDGGKSMLEVCQLVVQILGFSNTAFVNTVYQNVVGVAPPAADRDYFVGLLQGSGGTMTQADLLVLASNAGVNEQNINLVGLQASGVEFM